jgi:hypothetical protein
MKDYSSLPDGMEPEAVAQEFEDLLAEAARHGSPSDLEIADALCELADRQWHTYRKLRDDLRASVAGWLRDHWNFASAAFVEHAICTIGRLGLQELMPKVEAGLGPDTPSDVRELLRDYWEETRGDVSDPFRGMKAEA